MNLLYVSICIHKIKFPMKFLGGILINYLEKNMVWEVTELIMQSLLVCLHPTKTGQRVGEKRKAVTIHMRRLRLLLCMSECGYLSLKFFGTR